MKKFFTLFLVLCASASFAHFQTLIPSTDVVTPTAKTASFHMEFTHPFEQGPIMEMVKPKDVSVYFDGKKTDLLKSVTKTTIQGKSAWDFKYSFAKPGDYIFTVTPDYYFEPAEGVFIQHITKTVVNAFGMEEGWDTPVGLKAEIVPLTRPYGLWKGNTFTGKVIYKGKAVPNAEVEVEFYNKGSKIKHPTDAHITQVIKADANGVFTYAMPFAGWWAFAALIEDDVTLKHEGKDYPVELGAVFWVKTYGAD
ncbi:MAG: DUF4198 domain-containing protein [Geovibrio sp.]|nr:DUF4198 domain-containing protein [Geovibrio sp.]